MTRARAMFGAALGALLLVGVLAAAPAEATGDRPEGVASIQNVNAKLLRDGGVTVTVRIACQKGWNGGEISMQVSGYPNYDAYVSGYTVVQANCNGKWQRVRFDLPVGYGRLHTGPVTMTAQFLVNNDLSGDSAGAHDTLVRRLHR